MCIPKLNSQGDRWTHTQPIFTQYSGISSHSHWELIWPILQWSYLNVFKVFPNVAMKSIIQVSLILFVNVVWIVAYTPWRKDHKSSDYCLIAHIWSTNQCQTLHSEWVCVLQFIVNHPLSPEDNNMNVHCKLRSHWNHHGKIKWWQYATSTIDPFKLLCSEWECKCKLERESTNPRRFLKRINTSLTLFKNILWHTFLS